MQISKLMIIPLSALLESWIFSSKVPAKGYISMALVLTGVAIV